MARRLAAFGVIVEFNLPAMQFDKAAGERKYQTGAAPPNLGIAVFKGFEEVAKPLELSTSIIISSPRRLPLNAMIPSSD